MPVLKFVKKCDPYNVDEFATFTDEAAVAYVTQGIAVVFEKSPVDDTVPAVEAETPVVETVVETPKSKKKKAAE